MSSSIQSGKTLVTASEAVVAPAGADGGHDGLAGLLAMRLVLLSVAALLPAIGIGFMNGDDQANFLDNVGFRGVRLENLEWAWVTVMIGVYQPVAWMLLGVQYAAWGLNPRGYHIASLALHSANSGVLYFLTVSLLNRCFPDLKAQDRARYYWAAAASVAVFAVHPLRAEAVSWVSCQPYLPCALFSMLTVLTYLRAHEPGRSLRSSALWLAGSFGLCVAAVLSKAPAVTVPAVLLILDVFPLRRLGVEAGVKGWVGRRALWVYFEKVPFVALSVGMMVVAVFARHSLSASVVYPLGFRIAQSCYGVAFYLLKTFVPQGLTAFYPFPIRPDWSEPRFLLSMAFVVGASLAAFRVRRRFPAFTAGWAAYFVILAPSSGIVPMGRAMTADRYSYLSMIAWVAPLAAGLFLLTRPGKLSRGAIFGLKMAGVAAVAGLSVLSWFQCGTWRSDEALWTHALEHAGGDSADVHNGLGLALAQQGLYPEAEMHFARAIAIEPDLASAQNNMGLVLLDQNKLERAMPHFFKSLELMPTSASVYNNLGMILTRQNKPVDARNFFQEAVRLNPHSPEMHNNLGMSLLELGETRKAVAQFSLALRIKPTYARARRNLDKALASRENRASAG